MPPAFRKTVYASLANLAAISLASAALQTPTVTGNVGSGYAATLTVGL